MSQPKFKALNSKPELVDDRTIRFTATSEQEDRDGDIVRVSGIRTENFDKNPVFLWAHDSGKPPVGKVVSHNKRPVDGEFIVDVEFFDGEHADKIFKMYKEGFLNSVSISFDPKDFAERDEGGFDFLEVELLEISAVTIPANPHATAHSRRAYSSRDKMLKSMVAEVDKATDFPEEGDDQKVSLRNSQYERPPLDFVQNVKEEHPDIWDAGGNTQGNDSYAVLEDIVEDNDGSVETDTQEEIVRRREAWAARHFEDFQLAGVVAQLKWLVVGSRGFDHQRDVINEAIEDEEDGMDEDKALELPTVQKGERFSMFLQTLIATRLEEDQPQAELVTEMADLSDKSPSTVRDYIAGAVQCPPIEFMEAAAQVLQVEAETLAAIAARDGCEYDVTAFPGQEPEEDSGHMDEEDGMDEKSMDADTIEQKVPTDFQDFPIGDDPDEEWARERSVNEAREHASSDDSGDKETIDWDLYADHFLYYDGDEPENFTSYKFPYTYHDEDGNMYVPLQGIFVVAQFLEQEPDPPQDGDVEAAKRHIARYYRKAQEKFPDRDISDPEDVFEDIELSNKGNDMDDDTVDMLKARIDSLEETVDQLADQRAEAHEDGGEPDKSIGQTFELPIPEEQSTEDDTVTIEL